MRAWCPTDDVRYLVSLSEMGDMSSASRYFVRGFLSGNEVGPPADDDGETAPADLAAWIAATRRFRQTGSWFGRWRTCRECGCVLLPDRAAEHCSEHAPRASEPT
jgi:hypothetical protein